MNTTYPPALISPSRRTSARLDRPRRRTVVRLWLPLTPILWLLGPLPLLLAPLGYLVPPRLRPDPFFLVFAVGETLLALSGVVVDVDTPNALVRIRIF